MSGSTIAIIMVGTLVFSITLIGFVVWYIRRPEQQQAVIRSDPALDLSELRRKDPAFSLPMFENFVFELVGAIHRGRSDRQLGDFRRYVSVAVVEHLAGRRPVPSIVMIGALRVQDHSTISRNRDQLEVEVEATLLGAGTPKRVVEMWKLTRDEGQQTPEPSSHPRTTPCTSCGAITDTNRPLCAHCGKPIATAFTWSVDRMWLVSETTANASLTGSVPEQGNDVPTVRQTSVDLAMRHLTATDSNVTMPALQQRIALIYHQLNTAWNANDLQPVRGLVTASLRNYLDYWLREYQAQRLRNRNDEAKIAKAELVKVTRDLYYDAFTVRLYANGFDYTTDEEGNVVGGSRNKRRRYTEYWTFIRSASRTGAVNATTACPNCGAPQSLSDAGECTHCNAMIENGAFDWVLSKIEQDDSYGG